MRLAPAGRNHLVRDQGQVGQAMATTQDHGVRPSRTHCRRLAVQARDFG